MAKAKGKGKAKAAKGSGTTSSLVSLYAHLKVPEDHLGPGELAGSLDHLGLPELLQILEANKKTGFLLVKAGDKKGHIVFSKGKILNGKYEKLEGALAIYTLIQEREGVFRFLPLTEIPPEDKINKKASELILEAVKLMEGG